MEPTVIGLIGLDSFAAFKEAIDAIEPWLKWRGERFDKLVVRKEPELLVHSGPQKISLFLVGRDVFFKDSMYEWKWQEKEWHKDFKCVHI